MDFNFLQVGYFRCKLKIQHVAELCHAWHDLGLVQETSRSKAVPVATTNSNPKVSSMTGRALCLLVLCVALLNACGNKSRDEMMLQGTQLVEQGNPKGAIVVFKSLLEKYPGDIPASMALAEAYVATAKLPQAESELKAIMQKAPATPGLSVLFAKILIAQRKPQEALDALKSVLDAPGASGEAWEQAGHALMLLGWFDEAQRSYQKALSISGGLSKSRIGLAESYFQRKLTDQARREIDLILVDSPKNQSALHMLAQIQILGNDDDGVIETYGKIGKYHPSDVRARYMEAFLRLSRKQDVDYAQTVSTALIGEFPKAPEGYKLKGLVYLAKTEGALALEPLLTAHKLRPDIDTNLFLAQAYLGLGNLETAISHLQSVLSAKPDLEGPRRMLASIYLRQNRLDEAIAETQKIFEMSPSDVGGQRILADALVAKKEYDKGLELFTKMSEQPGSPPVVFLKKGMLLAMKGDNVGAEVDLRKAVEVGGTALEPRLYLSSFLAGQNRIDEAVEVLRSGMTEGAGAALAYNGMAKLRLRQNKLDEARELLEKAKQLEPKVLVTYYNLAAIQAATGNLDKVVAEFEAALAVAPEDQRALTGAAGAWETQGDLAKAQALLERAAKNRNPQASLALASFFVRRSDNARAIVVLDEMLAANPKDIPGWLTKARLHAVMGEQEKALSSLGRVETLSQRLGLLEKAKYYLSQKNTAQAIEVAQKLRSMNTRSGDYALPLAEIQEMAGQTDAAKATLRNVLNDDSSNPRVLTALANIESRSNNTPEALALLDKGIAAGMDPATGNALKGMILQQKGDLKGAQELYEKALRFQERQALALNNLAMIYADQEGQATKALELAVKAYTLESNSASVMDTLGYALLKNGRAKEALVVLERAKKLMPTNKDIEKHLEMARANGPAT